MVGATQKQGQQQRSSKREQMRQQPTGMVGTGRVEAGLPAGAAAAASVRLLRSTLPLLQLRLPIALKGSSCLRPQYHQEMQQVLLKLLLLLVTWIQIWKWTCHPSLEQLLLVTWIQKRICHPSVQQLLRSMVVQKVGLVGREGRTAGAGAAAAAGVAAEAAAAPGTGGRRRTRAASTSTRRSTKRSIRRAASTGVNCAALLVGDFEHGIL